MKHPKNGMILKKNQSLEQIWKVEYTSQIQVDMVVGNQIQGYYGSEYGPHNPRRSQQSKREHQLGIGICLVKGLQGCWGGVLEYLVFQPSGIIKFGIEYISDNSIAYGHGCGDSVSYILCIIIWLR